MGIWIKFQLLLYTQQLNNIAPTILITISGYIFLFPKHLPTKFSYLFD